MEYSIVEGGDLKDLCRAVSKAMLDGWMPQGGIAKDEMANHWCQAMMRGKGPPAGEVRLREAAGIGDILDPRSEAAAFRRRPR